MLMGSRDRKREQEMKKDRVGDGVKLEDVFGIYQVLVESLNFE